MQDRESESSSEDNLSDESDLNLVNLYDSDVENSVVPVEHSGPRPYQFEPRSAGVGQNKQQASSRTIQRTIQCMASIQTVLESQTGIESFC